MALACSIMLLRLRCRRFEVTFLHSFHRALIFSRGPFGNWPINDNYRLLLEARSGSGHGVLKNPSKLEARGSMLKAQSFKSKAQSPKLSS